MCWQFKNKISICFIKDETEQGITLKATFFPPLFRELLPLKSSSTQPKPRYFERCYFSVFCLCNTQGMHMQYARVFSSVQFSTVTQPCLTLCDPMKRSTPGFPVHHQLPEFTQTHVHRVSDAIQPSHPRSSPSPPAHNPSQHQSLFQ